MKSKKKLNVKDLQQRTDGNEMDLSMNQIDEIPVKDIVRYSFVVSVMCFY